ncbi:cystathionine gamma-synthase [Dendrothele bispora CBS 962.96]|uniref:Cystathionine gamma-synthase n=1 Tax=Dendrothele bispora (strain CBS 962.96) TaxID=1314807 RepID=A0A4S8MZ97_DENBC|nr:cystathionine gamma-synthase [Dendrothele bispora CBS 962.96]
MSPKLKAVDLIHGDASVHGGDLSVAPPISVTTTFLADPVSTSLVGDSDQSNPSRHVYSRYTQNISTRVEHILGKINHGHAVTYASGLASAFAALVFLKPKRIAIRGGYWGCHVTIEIYRKCRDLDVPLIDIDDEFKPGDLCWLETPVNPLGESRDIQYYADKIHKVGGKLLVDSTFAPPPLQYPFDFGADIVLHSATKYFGGHSDLLGGVLIVKTQGEWKTLQENRTYMGNMMGSLEAWLLLRSLRTLHLRVARQSQTAAAIATWLKQVVSTPKGKSFDGVPGGLIQTVWHSSLQETDKRGFSPSKQMTGGWNATFSILMSNAEHAKLLPHATKYFVAATSLGGVESLIEYRARADPREDPRLVRLSIGVEDFEDLRDDLKQALQNVAQAKAKL